MVMGRLSYLIPFINFDVTWGEICWNFISYLLFVSSIIFVALSNSSPINWTRIGFLSWINFRVVSGSWYFILSVSPLFVWFWKLLGGKVWHFLNLIHGYMRCGISEKVILKNFFGYSHDFWVVYSSLLL